ncbi:MAG: HD domain-containing phosphohydrolase, partial [bacterium]
TRLPIELINKPSELSADEWTAVRRHPTYGALALAGAFPFEERTCQAMLVAYEHHLNVDGSGYPVSSDGRLPTLMSRIVAVADCFEAMTSGRSYRREPISPDKALQKMLLLAGKRLDAQLFKVFVNVVSVYPPGTLLLLDSGELAVATAQNSSDLLRPKAMLIGNREGLFEEGKRIDLSERQPASRSYRHSIVTSIDPSRLSVDLGRYLLEDSE